MQITAARLAAPLAIAGLFLASSMQPSLADEAPAAVEPAAPPSPQLNYRSGDIKLPNGKASLRLGSQYRYLDAAETEKLLVAWGNPPEASKDTQGTIVPQGVDPFGENAWAVVLTYIDDGHVDDSDARKIDYAEMLEDMQKSARDENPERQKAGYGTLDIVGWASAPRYDDVSHKLYWAKELKFNGAEVNTLNYDVRVLGREGVLSMNAVGTMSQLSAIQQDMQSLLKVAEFDSGQRYADYNKSTDKVAAYGLGALVAGGVAAKLGLFAKLGVMILAFKKVLIAAVVGIGALVSRWFKGRSSKA